MDRVGYKLLSDSLREYRDGLIEVYQANQAKWFGSPTLMRAIQDLSWLITVCEMHAKEGSCDD